MSTSDITRKRDTGEPGNPGEFGTTGRASSGLTLPAAGEPATVDDTRTMNTLAYLLGRPADWDGAADYLDDIANTVARTGRPHPGSSDGDDYADALAAWSDAQPEPVDPRAAEDRARVSEIAAVLGVAQEWDSECLDDVASAVAASGRPHPGRARGGAYSGQLDRWNLDRGIPGHDPYRTWPAVAATGYPLMQGVLGIVGNRESNGIEEALAGLNHRDVSGLYGEHIKPARDAMVAELAFAYEGPDMLDSDPREIRAAEERTWDVCTEAGYETMAELLLSRYREGGVPTSMLADLSDASVEDLYERFVAPAVDDVEDELLGYAQA